MSTQLVRRKGTMLDQLNKASEEYVRAREAFDAARVEYDVAREKFASVRRLAANVLSGSEWWHWRFTHDSVQFTGLKIGEAIVEALEGHAYASAWKHYEKNEPYRPAMTLEQLQDTLERGGFEFRSTAALREVNAALMNLPKVERAGASGYRVKNHDEILKVMKPKPELAPEPVMEAPIYAKQDDDDVPF